MRRFTLLLVAFLVITPGTQGHDVITTSITWNRAISRIVYERCASCHRERGRAFSLMTYTEARPWAVAIKEEVLSRRMPPWGAVKGFGDFRDEQALTPEQIGLITSWVEGGVPEGDPKDLLPPPQASGISKEPHAETGIVAQGEFILMHDVQLEGLIPGHVPDSASVQIVAELPDGGREPLIWLYEYKPAFEHPFYFRTPINLPARTVIRGIPQGVRVTLILAAREGVLK